MKSARVGSSQCSQGLARARPHRHQSERRCDPPVRRRKDAGRLQKFCLPCHKVQQQQGTDDVAAEFGLGIAAAQARKGEIWMKSTIIFLRAARLRGGVLQVKLSDFEREEGSFHSR